MQVKSARIFTKSGDFRAVQEGKGRGGRMVPTEKSATFPAETKYPSWQIELKNIVDTFKNRKILVSGSSSLDIKRGKGDLSRRLASYDLKGLSFREYLHLKEGRQFPILGFEEILRGHLKSAQKISSQFPVLKSFQHYLQRGYYPFFVEGESSYLQKVTDVIEKVLYEDVATLGRIKPTNVEILKKIVWLVASSSPFTINIERMSRDLKISKEFVYQYLGYLEEASLIIGLKPMAHGFKLIRKPTKLFFENPNLLYATSGGLPTEADKGTARETFFVNQVRSLQKITVSEDGDFLVGGKYTFEVGGKNKGFDQLTTAKDGYVAADRIEIGAGRKIPLYLFGFLY